MEESARYAYLLTTAVIALSSSVVIVALVWYESHLDDKANNPKTQTMLKFVLATQVSMIVILTASSISFFLILSRSESLLEVIFWATAGIAYAYFALTVVCLIPILFSSLTDLLRKR